ncbi:flagellar hook-length control protein FliK [Burkholderia vietnamiensis]|uniref:hypothetical protein n=1 Tax=Burkholderia vietnamiensis TaxID=60552 RepID=UPI00075B9C89|nr:hypothetical protein [Burkholderia vietnamiensis]KVF20131.1 flagellar hook-length control protein FliK [Burkholderia vietnamiensis]
MATTFDDAATGSTTVLPVDGAASNAQVPVQESATTNEAASEITTTSTGAPASGDTTTSAVAQADKFPATQTASTASSNDGPLPEATTTQDSAPRSGLESGAPVLDHVFVGLDGTPIKGLKYRFESDGAIIDGVTDGDGKAAPVNSFSAGADCAVLVLTDSGAYKQVACYTVPTADTSATLMSGSMVLESETQPHAGSSDDAAREPSPPVDDTRSSQSHPAYSSQDESTAGGASSAPSTTNDNTPAAATSGNSETIKATDGRPGAAASSTPPVGSAKSSTTPLPKKGTTIAKGSSGKGAPSTTTTAARDKLGHPQAAPTETFTDWASHKVHAAWHFIEDLFGLDWNPVAGTVVRPQTPASAQGGAANTSSAPRNLTAVQSLISIAEGQTEHSMPSSATVVNLKKIADGSITYGSKPSKKSKGQCYMYVKIALWRGNAIKFIKNKKGDFDAAGGSYAKVAGEFLMSQGFVNVTDQLPDARWALPGDVIVYHVKGDAETADGRGQPGHIDIRTYHYYVSDFKRNYLCFSGGGGTHFYEVSGIYRKPGYFDPLALARMKAFLKIIRSREAKAFFSFGDEKTYFASQGVYKIQNGIKDFSTYPSNPQKAEDHQGAYQIARSSWKRGHALGTGALPSDFTPQTQDRYAVWLMEGEPGRFGPKPECLPAPSALGYIRQGDIDQAVSLLRKRQWPSLPGGGQDQGYTMTDMKADFDKYLREYGGS